MFFNTIGVKHTDGEEVSFTVVEVLEINHVLGVTVTEVFAGSFVSEILGSHDEMVGKFVGIVPVLILTGAETGIGTIFDFVAGSTLYTVPCEADSVTLLGDGHRAI